MAAVLASLAGCSGGGSGVIVGFVVDGQTGAPINFFKDNGTLKNLQDDATATNQIYSIVDGSFVRATPCGSGVISDTNKIPADGCFKISGVPFGEKLPIFASFGGYERFHGEFDYPGAVLDPSGKELTPAPKQLVGNIRLFPKNYTVDYKILVHLDGRGVNDVTVACQIRQASVGLDIQGDFIPPLDTMSPTLTGNTGADDTYGDGFLKINGGDLVLGATYHCEAFRKDLYSDSSENPTDGVLTGSVDFVAGVDAPEVSLEVKPQDVKGDASLIYAVYSNADDPTTPLGQHAKLIITFNRAVEVVPSSQDCQTATIKAPDTNGNGNTIPAEPQNIPGNNASEQVSITTSGDTGLAISFMSPLDPFDPGDIGSTVTFGGILIRPKDASGSTTDINAIRGIGGGGLCGVQALPLKNLRTGKDQTATLSIY
jgi:hypothetical protein